MTYRYVKAPPGYTLKKPISFGRRLRFGISLLFLTLGTATATSVAYPLLSYQLDYAPRFQKGETVSPIPPSPIIATTTTVNPIIKTVKAADNPTFASEVVNTSLDYTDASSWFVGASPNNPGNAPYLTYTLSIPKLGITDALVHTNNTDLKKSLIQYGGTAMPGDLGNTVVFGHSVLPQFFNPKNYLTIFSTLYLLHPGDTIQVTADGATYNYKIIDMYEVQPDDLSPLAQTYDGSYLTLITCTPSGTYLRRLIVKAQVV